MIADARMAAMKLLYELTDLSNASVGEIFGRETAYHARRASEDQCETNAAFRARVDRIRAAVQSQLV